MPLLTEEHRLSAKPFAAVPALLELPEIKCGPASVSNVSSHLSFVHGLVDLEEGCLITKSVKYAHRLAYMVNAARSGDPKPIENLLEYDLEVIPYMRFNLEDPCNLTLLEPFVHTSLDLYAFIALSPSSSTVNGLINMVKSDNDRRQQEMDRMGSAGDRLLNFRLSSFTNPEYELVALHPEHFLPRGSVLPIYDPATRICKNYVPSRDRYLRESIEADSARLPAFRHDLQNREESDDLNIFLVALNAEIKFRRYFKMIQAHPHTTPLPDDVVELMHRVIELVDLLYWVPVPTKGSKGHTIFAERGYLKRKNPERAGRPSQSQYTETASDEEGGMDLPTPSEAWKTSKCPRRQLDWLADADLETRRAYGSYLMSGHDLHYDPALFEDAFPIEYPHLYSDNATLEKWNQKGHTILAERSLLKRKNPEGTGRPSQPQYTETASDEEGGMDLPTPSEAWKMSKRPRRQLDWLADADVETRKAYGSYLMSGHDLDYDPALFEDAFPMDDPHLYSDTATIEKWNQGVAEGLTA